MSLKTIYARSARRDLRKLPNEDRGRIVRKIEALASGAENVDVKRLKGGDGESRMRVGDYRVIFVMDRTNDKLEIRRVRRRNEATYDLSAWLALWGL